MKKKYVSWLCGFTLAMCMAGCGKKIPEDIIQPEQFEPILYDYHLAVTLSADVPYEENYKKNAYRDYVFQKHGITEAEFDSSMVWYSRNTTQLAAIYESLQKRFEADEKRIRKYADRRSGQTSLALLRDTVEMSPIYWLSSSEITNKFAFELKTDTSFKPKDAIIWKADFVFLPETEAEAVVGLNFTFANDSTQGITRVIKNSGRLELVLKADSAFEFKRINGFVYYSGDTLSPGNVLIYNNSFTRRHDKNADLPAEENKGLKLQTR